MYRTNCSNFANYLNRIHSLKSVVHFKVRFRISFVDDLHCCLQYLLIRLDLITSMGQASSCSDNSYLCTELNFFAMSVIDFCDYMCIMLKAKSRKYRGIFKVKSREKNVTANHYSKYFEKINQI